MKIKKFIFIATGKGDGFFHDSKLAPLGREQITAIASVLKSRVGTDSVELICPTSVYGKESAAIIGKELNIQAREVGGLYPVRGSEISDTEILVASLEKELETCVADILIVVTTAHFCNDVYRYFDEQKNKKLPPFSPEQAPDKGEGYEIDLENCTIEYLKRP